MKKVVILFGLVVLFASSCSKSELESKVPDVSFTPCRQDILRSNSLSDKVDVEFTGKGVQITHYNFAVTCDFTTVNVTHTFVNGVLNITQQGSPNQANCICYTDISYTIEGISQNEVNVIFINGVQVYCYNYNINKNSIIGTWREIYPSENIGNLLTFSDNDTIYLNLPYDNSVEKWKWTYHIINDDSIQILRSWETSPNQRKTNNRIVFYNSDSILIENFYPSDAAVYPHIFIDITLLKTRLKRS